MRRRICFSGSILAAFSIAAIILIIVITCVKRLQTSSPSKTQEVVIATPIPPASRKANEVGHLRVIGCNPLSQTDGIQNVEPSVAPGASWRQMLEVYGEHFESDKFARKWRRNGYEISADDYKNGVTGTISVSTLVEGGKSIETIDGFILGKDTYGYIVQTLNAKNTPYKEFIEEGEGVWLLNLAIKSECGDRFVGVYAWTIEGSEEVDRAIGSGEPFHTKVFIDKPVESYSLNLMKGYYEKQSGYRTDHDLQGVAGGRVARS